MLEREDDRLRDEDATGLLVDGGGQDVGVDGEGVVPHSSSFTHQPEGGVFRGQKVPKVLVQHKDQLCNTCIPERVRYGSTRRWLKNNISHARSEPCHGFA